MASRLCIIKGIPIPPPGKNRKRRPEQCRPIYNKLQLPEIAIVP